MVRYRGGGKDTYVQHPNETQFPMTGGAAGGGGAASPLQNKLRRPPAPQSSSESPAQGVLQSDAVVFVPPFLMKLSQSVN